MSFGLHDRDWIDPPDPVEPMAWCDCCGHWRNEYCVDGMGWCVQLSEFTEPDYHEECGDFQGEAPAMDDGLPDDPRIDMILEERGR